jgi:hypothetical protein
MPRPSWRRRLKSYAKHHTMDDLLMWAVAVSIAAAVIYYLFW